MNNIYKISLVLECIFVLAILILLILDIKHRSMFYKKVSMIAIALAAIIQIPQIYLEYILEGNYSISVVLFVMWTINFFMRLSMFLESKRAEKQRKALETSFVEDD